VCGVTNNSSLSRRWCLLFGLAFIILTASVSAATYYISPSGNDATGYGTINNPWKSLFKACNNVTSSGSTIHVNSGTYIETEQCNLSVGVSIEGEGRTSNIKFHRDWGQGAWNNCSILLLSSSEGTNGNQSISNLKLDGEYGTNASFGSCAILVKKRSNVKLHDLNVVNFFRSGITFAGANSQYTEPAIYAKGNEIYSCNMSNSGDTPTTWDGIALIQIGGQDGLLIHDNIFNQTGRAIGHNGEILSGGLEYNKGLKFYNNKCYKYNVYVIFFLFVSNNCKKNELQTYRYFYSLIGDFQSR
jgi:hypothetical protein